jgi:hypothetical protein
MACSTVLDGGSPPSDRESESQGRRPCKILTIIGFLYVRKQNKAFCSTARKQKPEDISYWSTVSVFFA